MIGQLWSISNLVICIFMYRAFVNEDSGATAPSTSDVDSKNPQLLSSHLDTQQARKVVKADVPKVPNKIKDQRSYHNDSFDSGFKITNAQRLSDESNGEWFLDFIGVTKTTLRNKPREDMGYSDADTYDPAMKTAGNDKLKDSASINSDAVEVTEDILVFFGVLAGCVVITLGILSLIQSKRPETVLRQITRQSEDMGSTREAQEDRTESFQVKSHWLRELGNKM